MAARVLGLDISERHVRGVVLEVHGRNIRLAQLIEEPIRKDEDLSASPSTSSSTATPSSTETLSLTPDTDAASEAPEDASASPLDADDATSQEMDPESEETAPVPVLSPIARSAWDDATRQTVHRILHQSDLEIDAVVCAAPEGAFMYTLLELPFNADREIRGILGPQLDDKLPGETEELHFDYMIAGPKQENGWRMYAGGIAEEEMAQVLAQWEAAGADPRIIDVLPFPLYTAGEWLASSKERTIAYMDMGSTVTRILIAHNGTIEIARTIPGGSDAIDEAVATAFNLPLDLAHVYAHPPQLDAQTEEEYTTRLNEALDQGLRSTIRDLRRTLAAHGARAGHNVEQIYVSGSAFDQQEVQKFLTNALQLPLEPLKFDRAEVNTIADARRVSHRFIMALGLALRMTSVAPHSGFNLRTGRWAFRGAYAYITQRIPALLMLAGVLLFSLFFFVFARNALLKAEFEAADDGLAEVSKQVLGVAVRDPDLVTARLGKGVEGAGLHPDISAYEIAVRISNAATSTVDNRNPLTLENIDVDMSRRQVRVSGIVDSANGAETFGRFLRNDNCLKSVERNNLSQRRADSQFDFSYTATVRCTLPEKVADVSMDQNNDQDADADQPMDEEETP